MNRFVAKVMQEDTDQLIFLVTGWQKEKPVWCYAQIPSRLRQTFMQALLQGRVDVARFGHILFSGTGAAPPYEIERIIAAHYN